MKKITSKIKKIFAVLGTFFFSIYTKVLAMSITNPPEILYGVYPIEPDLYGVPRGSSVPLIWRIARSFVIPIAFIVGAIIYFKKSKSSLKRKIIVLVISLVAVAMITLGLNYIITNL